MKHAASTLLLSVLVLLLFSSCGGDDDGVTSSREVKYEVTGNFSGLLGATYITANGGGTSESITSLPWTKSLTYKSSVSATTLSAAGANGTSGQTITIKVFVGGKLESTTSGTATTTGSISVTAPTYMFK